MEARKINGIPPGRPGSSAEIAYTRLKPSASSFFSYYQDPTTTDLSLQPMGESKEEPRYRSEPVRETQYAVTEEVYSDYGDYASPIASPVTEEVCISPLEDRKMSPCPELEQDPG